MMQSIDLTQTYVQLMDGAEARPVAVGADFWETISAHTELHAGRLVMLNRCGADWAHWEMHPSGDEIVFLLSGAVDLVLVGSDIPQLRRHHIVQAFAALGRADVVFGPANDGGFWLIGVRRPALASTLFADVRWSTPHSLADSLAGLPAARRVELVDVLVDVDSAADLRLLAPAARPAGAGCRRRG